MALENNHESNVDSAVQLEDDVAQQQERDPAFEVLVWRMGARVVISHEARLATSDDYRQRFLAAQAGAAALLDSRNG